MYCLMEINEWMNEWMNEWKKKVEFLFGRNVYFEKGTNHADFHGDANY